jgi:hypothetical protein
MSGDLGAGVEFGEGEDGQIGDGTDANDAPVGYPEELRLPCRDGMHRFFDGQGRGVADQVGEQVGGVARAAEHLHVGTGVARAGEAARRSYEVDGRGEVDGLAGSTDVAAEIGLEEPVRHDVGGMPTGTGDGVGKGLTAVLTADQQQAFGRVDWDEGVGAGVPV